MNPYLTTDYTLDDLDAAACALENRLAELSDLHARLSRNERHGIVLEDKDIHSGFHQLKAFIETAIKEVREAIAIRKGQIEARHVERDRRLLADQQV